MTFDSNEKSQTNRFGVVSYLEHGIVRVGFAGSMEAPFCTNTRDLVFLLFIKYFAGKYCDESFKYILFYKYA